MNIKEKLIQNYPLINKVKSELDCYVLNKRRYLIFLDDLIEKNSIENTLNYLEEKTKSVEFTKFKTLIVVSKTKEKFTKKELLYFNNIDTFVVFYLINENSNKIYMNSSWIFALGLNYKKYIRKINKILNN